MPASHRIDTDRRVVFSTGEGTVTDDDLRAHQRAVLTDPAFDPSFSQLYDFRSVSRMEVTGACIRVLAEKTSYAAGARRAIVAPQDALYGMARMFQTLADEGPAEVRVFRAFDDAVAWLGIA